MSPRYRAVVFITTVVLMLGLVWLSAWNTGRTARESEQKWCSVVNTMVEAYSVQTPTTEIGRRLAAGIRELQAEFDCPPA
jgi:hypothetical protein